MQVLSFTPLSGVSVCRAEGNGRVTRGSARTPGHARHARSVRTAHGGFVPTRKTSRAPSLSSTNAARSVTVFASDKDDKPTVRGGEDEPDRDEEGLYIGTYSNFFTDPDQIKGVIIFCAFLASFASLGNIGAAILLPMLYGQPIQSCIQGILFGYYCPP